MSREAVLDSNVVNSISRSPTTPPNDAITKAIESAPSVTGLIHLRTMHLSPEALLVAAKIEYDRSLNMEQLAPAVDATEVAMRAATATELTIYIEPDIRRTAAS